MITRWKADLDDIAGRLISCALYPAVLTAAAAGTNAGMKNGGRRITAYPEGETVKRMMALGFFVWLAVTTLLSLAACANLPSKTDSLVRTLYVAPPEYGGAATGSGERHEPLPTIAAAVKKIAEIRIPPETAVIIIRGDINETALIEDRKGICPPIILRGESARYPGTVCGTITVGQGANVSLEEDLTVTGTGRGVIVAGGRFTLRGGIIAENVSQQDGAGVYVDSGVFIMLSGAVRNNTAVKGAGGGVYVQSGNFAMHGGKITDNVSSSGGIIGRAGGGVYVNADTGANFVKIGGVISDNRAARGYKAALCARI